MKYSNQYYTVHNSNDRELVIVGDTFYSRSLYENLTKSQWEPILVKLEDIEHNDQKWFDRRQFIAPATNVKTKKMFVERLAHRNPHYFTVLGASNQFDNVEIGHNVFIENFNTAVCNDIVIGNHVTMSNYICLGHNATVGDFSHLSCYSYVNFANLGEGSCVAARTSFFGDKDRILNITNDCNFMTGSTVTKDITATGTYYSNKRVSSESSISYDML
jgi:UDP-3-O-[3-hydroxymyristoyl] glucosamine N-acyltransferase